MVKPHVESKSATKIDNKTNLQVQAKHFPQKLEKQNSILKQKVREERIRPKRRGTRKSGQSIIENTDRHLLIIL